MKLRTVFGCNLAILLLGMLPNIIVFIAEPIESVFFYPEDPCQLHNNCHWIKELGFIGMVFGTLSLFILAVFNIVNGCIWLIKFIKKRARHV